MKMPFAAKSIRSAYGEAPAATETPGSCPVPGVGQVRAPGDGLKAAGAPPHVTRGNMRPAAPTSGNVAMFERRTDLLRLLAVAETGTIGAAAKRSNVTQPTLTRDIARLEQRFGGLLFDRTPHGVRPDRARRHGGGARPAHPARGRGRRAGHRCRPIGAHRRVPRHRNPAVDRDRARPGGGPLPGDLPRRRAPHRQRHPCRGAAPPRRRRLRPALRRHRHRRTPAGVPAPRAFPRHDRRHRRLARSPAVRRIRRPERSRALPVDRLRLAGARLARRNPPVARRDPGAAARGGAAGIVTVLRLGAAGLLPWPAAPGSPGSRRNCWNACPAASSGPCRSSSGATATAPDSSPGARPKTCRRSGRWSRPCATRRWGGMASWTDCRPDSLGLHRNHPYWPRRPRNSQQPPHA